MPSQRDGILVLNSLIVLIGLQQRGRAALRSS
jgi:hypothetical protein